MHNTEDDLAKAPIGISEARSHSIIDASPLPMALNDERQNITYLNPAFIRTFGYTLADIPTLSHWWPQAYPDPEYRQWISEVWQSEIERSRQTGTDFVPIEVSIVCKNGSNKSVLASAAPLCDQFKGEHLVLLYDITERKQAELSLLKSEARFQLLFEGARDAIFLADADTGLLIDCNVAAENLLGRNRSEIIGQPQTFLHPTEDADEYRELFRARVRTGRSTNPEVEVLRKDGSRPVVSVAASITTVGTQRVIQGIFRDITERKKEDETLQMMRFSVDHAGDSVFWVSRTGQILYANRSACVSRGYAPDELNGMSIFDLDVEPQYQPDVWEKHFDETRQRGTITLETRHRTKDGRIFPVEVNTNYVQIGDKEFLFAFVRDISERKRIEEELRSSRQRLELLSRQLISTQETERARLARELHDEIGQVLTAIKINLRRTQRSADSQVQSHLNESLSMVEQAVVQVRELALRLRPAQLDELGLVAALHWLIKQQADLGGFDDQLEVNMGDVEIPAETQTACFRIAQEALTNAVRHGKPTRVRMKLWVDNEQLLLSIHDNGVGFEVEKVRQRSLKGSCFGMTSMQERANLAGGQTKIESAPGQGTTIQASFTLTDASSRDTLSGSEGH